MSEKQGPPPAYPGYEGLSEGFQAPPPGYPPQTGYQGQQQTSAVVVQPSPVLAIQLFRETPVRTKCPQCSSDIITSTYFETGTLAWIACLILFFVGCWAGCCLIPFCVDGCKDVVHSCPNCNATVGRFNRM